MHGMNKYIRIILLAAITLELKSINLHLFDVLRNYYQKKTKPFVTSNTTLKRTTEKAPIQGVTYSFCRLSTTIFFDLK